MRHNPLHASDDPLVVRRLIRENPWGILVSTRDGELVASHAPILLDDEADDMAIITHVGRPDETIHGFGDREILLVVQGRHGYVSPSWHAPGEVRAPTWNFSVAHCYGVPQLLDEEETLGVLSRLVAHFEHHVEEPMLLDLAWGRRVARGTVGLRLPITRFVCKVKLSQDKKPGPSVRSSSRCAHPVRIRTRTSPRTWLARCSPPTPSRRSTPSQLRAELTRR